MKVSLRIKTVCAVLFSALMLAGTAAVISYRVYSASIYNHFESMTMNLAKTTAVTLDTERVKALRDAVLEIYRDVCEESGGTPDFEHFSDADWEAYYGRYDTVLEMSEYQDTLDVLHKIREANQVSSIYIGYMDSETLYGIYLADGSTGEDACLSGTCDPFEESNAARMKQREYDFPAYVTNYPDYGWLCSAGAGICDSNGEYVATALVDISMDEVMQNRQDFLRNLCLVLAGITVVLLAALIYLMSKIIIAPIKSLAWAAASFVSDKGKHGEENVQSAISKLKIHTGDEIEFLCASIKQMEQEINDYIENLTVITAEKERMGAELNVATEIQASMLPCIFPAFPEREEFDIYASMNPAKEVGGDFYDFFLIDKDHLALVMADVSGKGVPAALFMVIAKTLLKNSALNGSSPKEILEKVNNQLCENNEAEMFVTVWIGILTISSGNMICANAGHEYPAIRRAGGAYELFRDKHGFVLAGMEGARYREYEMKFCPGDALFVYTDGVAEATNKNDELFGTERMLAALNKGKEKGCETLLETVQDEIDRFVGDAPQFDDITMLSFLYHGCKKNEPAAEEKIVAAKTESLDEVLEFVQSRLKEKNCPKKAQTQIAIAVEEIFVNIANYAYGEEEGPATIQIAFEGEPLHAVIRFMDEGTPYNPLEKKDPDTSLSAEEREIGGLGIFMVKKSMDTMEYAYQDGKNILTIQKVIG